MYADPLGLASFISARPRTRHFRSSLIVIAISFPRILKPLDLSLPHFYPLSVPVSHLIPPHWCPSPDPVITAARVAAVPPEPSPTTLPVLQ